MRLKSIFLTALLASVSLLASAQKTWTLQECIDYAIENNISLQMSHNTYLSGLEDTQQAKAAMLPTLSGSIGQNFYNMPDDGTNIYSGNYGLNSSMTVFNGGKLRNAYKQKQSVNITDSLAYENSKIELKINITQAYINCLYAEDAIVAAKSTAESAKAQLDRGKEMKAAGSISRVDLAQLESQYHNYLYQITVAETSWETYKLQLKQLLELDITEEMSLSKFEATDDEVLGLIPDKVTVFADAMEFLPTIKRGEHLLQQAELAKKQAEAGVLPKVSLSASLGTSNTNTSESFGEQLRSNFNEGLGATVSIPIIDGRTNRTAINKAKIAYNTAVLTNKNTEKTVLKTIETTYLNAKSAQAQYISALEKEKYAKESYELTSEQFKVGKRNIVELITAQNELTSATQAAIQAKYKALLNKRTLEIYQGQL